MALTEKNKIPHWGVALVTWPALKILAYMAEARQFKFGTYVDHGKY